MRVDPVRNAVIISLVAAAFTAAVVLDARHRAARPVAVPYGSPCPPGLDGIEAEVVCTGRVPLNAAPAALLETLDGVGPSLARAIVEHRAREGPLCSAADLEKVRGIGPAKAARIAPQVSFDCLE